MAVAGQTCENCQHLWQYTPTGAPPNYQCHCETPDTWRGVILSDWCGRWEATGSGVVNQYVNGVADLQNTTVRPIAPADLGEFDILVLLGCQVVNTSSKEDCIVTFLDGPDPNKPIGFVSAPAHDSRDFRFNPGLRASAGNSICAKLDQDVAPSHVYVTAQGFALRSG